MLRIDAHTHAYPEKDRERVLERVRLPEEINKLIQRKGSEFFLFGSDNPWRRPEESWDRFLSLELSTRDREKIAGLNLERILGPCRLA